MKCIFQASQCADKQKDGSCGWSLEGKEGHHCAYAQGA